ncbi:hypothetical protein HanHA300_Chr17g0666911 [Helianthus annuus]|nr:hypothetical protein HanHA300_Chr17g0666911 [Helianthus annuus]KAJ0448683.1 hypothetical protein HanHA89_Chr17g0719781 [Helianthus annuus]
MISFMKRWVMRTLLDQILALRSASIDLILGRWDCMKNLLNSVRKKCWSFGVTRVERFTSSIMEWLSTLTKNDENDLPRTVTLTGKVNGKPTTMSLASLSQIAKFYSKADNFYTYIKEEDYFSDSKKIVAENVMYSELFLLEKGVALKRENLKPLVRVLLSLVVSNVAPRLGDMMGIRKWELVVLYALMTGEIHLSFRQLVIYEASPTAETTNEFPPS